jgi:hypothetical protein
MPMRSRHRNLRYLGRFALRPAVKGPSRCLPDFRGSNIRLCLFPHRTRQDDEPESQFYTVQVGSLSVAHSPSSMDYSRRSRRGTQ